MKLGCILALTAAIVLLLSCAALSYDAQTDYMELMLTAAEAGDVESGRLAQKGRDEKLEDLGLDYESVSFDDMYLLAKVIESEAGSAWLPEEWKMAVGEVVLNRVASPEFPDTLSGVVYQPGQYSGSGSGYFKRLTPSRMSAEIAARLLGGERFLNEPSVVFQSNAALGSGVFLEMEDELLGTTYFCLSSRPELYCG